MDPLHGNVISGLSFLQELLDTKDISYSTVNTARSALSLIIFDDSGIAFGTHPAVTAFMKGVYNLHPPRPKYLEIWDPDLVLKLLKTWSPAQRITLEKLTLKTVMLIMLFTGQRPQIIRSLRVDNMDIKTSKFIFTIGNEDIKQGRPNYKPEQIVLKAYPADRRICIFHYLRVYLEKTLYLRLAEKQLFITIKKPHQAASADTIARWLKTVLKSADIDTTVYKAASVRAASTSKAKREGATIQEIMKAGGWTRVSTFTKYYNKELVHENTFQAKVLKKN